MEVLPSQLSQEVKVAVDPAIIAEYVFPGSIPGFFTHLEYGKALSEVYSGPLRVESGYLGPPQLATRGTYIT